MSRVIAALALVVSMAASAADPTTLSLDGHKAMAPEIAVGPDGAVVIIWVERTSEGEQIAASGAASKEGHTHLAETDLWLARSADGGKTFSAPVRVNAKPGAVWGFPASKPRVMVAKSGTIHVFYPGNHVIGKTGMAIVLPMYTRSIDQGRTFSAPSVLGAVPTTDNSAVVKGGLSNAECFGTMTVDNRGGVFAYWIDTRDMSDAVPNGKIFSAVSLDDGVTFSKDFEVFPADACPCCQLTATTDAGRIFMGSRQVSAKGTRDSVVAVSTDRGRTFERRVRWGGAPWPIEACPLKPTALAINGDTVLAAAYDGGATPQAAYVSRSGDGGKSFAPAVQLHPGAAVSDAPVLAVLDGRIVAAWHAKTGAGRRVWLAVSRDDGRTFSAPVELPAPPGTGISPVMAKRAGGLQFAWQQDDAVMTQFVAANDPLIAK
jgi:hypothetical protein